MLQLCIYYLQRKTVHFFDSYNVLGAICHLSCRTGCMPSSFNFQKLEAAPSVTEIWCHLPLKMDLVSKKVQRFGGSMRGKIRIGGVGMVMGYQLWRETQANHERGIYAERRSAVELVRIFAEQFFGQLCTGCSWGDQGSFLKLCSFLSFIWE